MADVAWSAKRKALVPGEYRDGMFHPFNGDDPIPQSEVYASKPPLRMLEKNEAGQLEMMTIGEAFKAAHARDMQRARAIWKWAFTVAGAFSALVLVVIALPKRNVTLPSSTLEQPTPNLNEYGSLDVSDALHGIEAMQSSLFSRTKIDCSTNAAIVAELYRSLRRTFREPKLLEYGVRASKMKDGPVKLVGLSYSYEPGDRGVVQTAVDYTLVDKNCSVTAWDWRAN